MDGIPSFDGELAAKSISYVSDNMCYFGTLVGETDSTVIYKFTGVEDHLLIDGIPDDTLTMTFDPADNEPDDGSENEHGVYGLIPRYSKISMCTEGTAHPDANKKTPENGEFTRENYNHCWVATACNMLSKGGYFVKNTNVQLCFETMSNEYYIYDGEASYGGNVTRVFWDYLAQEANITNKKEQIFWKYFTSRKF